MPELAQAHLLDVGGHSAEGLSNLGVTIHSDGATCQSACMVMQYLSRGSSQ